MVYTGFSDVIGSWKIMEIALPRMSRSVASEARARSSPANSMEPPAMRPGGEGTSPMTASAVIDLPHPDSPTRPSVPRASSSNESRSSTGTVPSRVSNSTVRSRTLSNAPDCVGVIAGAASG